MALSRKQEAFALAIVRGLNASAAYREAYAPPNMSAKTINEAASRLLKTSKVSARIAELTAPALAASGLTAERVLKEVARLAFSDTRRLYREDGTLKRADEWDDETAAAVAGLEVTEEYDGRGETRTLSGHTKKLKLWDKNAALDKAMKHLGLYERDNAQRGESLAIQINLVR